MKMCTTDVSLEHPGEYPLGHIRWANDECTYELMIHDSDYIVTYTKGVSHTTLKYRDLPSALRAVADMMESAKDFKV